MHLYVLVIPYSALEVGASSPELRHALPFPPPADLEEVAHGQQQLWFVDSVAPNVHAEAVFHASGLLIHLPPINLRTRRSPCPMATV